MPNPNIGTIGSQALQAIQEAFRIKTGDHPLSPKEGDCNRIVALGRYELDRTERRAHPSRKGKVEIRKIRLDARGSDAARGQAMIQHLPLKSLVEQSNSRAPLSQFRTLQPMVLLMMIFLAC